MGTRSTLSARRDGEGRWFSLLVASSLWPKGLRCGAGREGEDPHPLRCSPSVRGHHLPLKHWFRGGFYLLEELVSISLGGQKPPVKLHCSQVLSPQPAPRPLASSVKWDFYGFFGVCTGEGKKEQVETLWFGKRVPGSELVLWVYSSPWRGGPWHAQVHRVPVLVLLPMPSSPSVLKGHRHYRVRAALRLRFFPVCSM